MSRKDELLKLANLCHLQANMTRSRATKQSLRKIGDHYQHEAERAPEDVQVANLSWFLRPHRPNEVDG